MIRDEFCLYGSSWNVCYVIDLHVLRFVFGCYVSDLNALCFVFDCYVNDLHALCFVFDCYVRPSSDAVPLICRTK